MSIKGKMFIILVALTISGGLFISPVKAVKATNYAEEIAALQPGTTSEEITKSASQIAKQQRVKTDVILKQKSPPIKQKETGSPRKAACP